MRVSIVALVVIISLVGRAGAQPDVAEVYPLAYGQTVGGDIRADNIFDWWRFHAVTGDIISARVTGTDGLAPQIGLLSADGSFLGSSLEGAVNETVVFEYPILADGEYTLVVTRVGNLEGETTGSYSLSFNRLIVPARSNPIYQPVVFPCRDNREAVTAATIEFTQDDDGPYRVVVYGFDGFRPAVRFRSTALGSDNCVIGAREAAGDTVTLPDGTTRTFSAADAETDAASLLVVGDADLGFATVIIGSMDGAAGRYLAVITGFSINAAADRDLVQVRLAPLPARSRPLDVYMVAVGGNNRLDPVIQNVDGERCDDAGRRGCAHVPALTGAGVVFSDGQPIIGDRFSAGYRLPAGFTDPVNLELFGFNPNAHGDYAIIVVGELPPRAMGE